MTIDPVVLLAEELRTTEERLRQAVQRYRVDYKREDGERVNTLLNAVKSLYRDFYETIPTSALGAAEMIRLVARRLPFAHARHAAHFHEVADRLGAGRRRQADLIWMRAMWAALSGGLCGEQGSKVAPLLEMALQGAARPVIVFRAALPMEDHPHNPGFWARRLQ